MGKMNRRRSAAGTATLILLLGQGLAFGQADKCINAMIKDGSKVAATKGKDISACIKSSGGAECVADDSSKVESAAAKVVADYDKNCAAAPPDFGLPAGGAEEVAAAATEEEEGLAFAVFGTGVETSSGSAGAKCQSTVSKTYEKAVAAYMKGYGSCVRSALKAGGGEAELQACVLDDARGTAAGALGKLTAAIDKTCAGLDAADLFPGRCASVPFDQLGECIGQQVGCRSCRMQNRMSRLGANCDVLDDGSANASCVNSSFLVSKTADTADGVCDGDCSLREAIIAANALSGSDEVILPAGTYVLTRTGADEDGAATGDLDILDDLVLRGGGAESTIIDGNASDRVLEIGTFEMETGPRVELSGLTIQNGNAVDGAGLLNGGSATITGCVIRDNFADYGGGIENYGVLSLRHSTISGNSTGVDGPEHIFYGGGVDNVGSMTITDSTISGNSSVGGGGIVAEGPTTIVNSTVSDNSSSILGGGVWSFGAITITDSTITRNSSPAGGGIYSLDGSLTIVNSAISNNDAPLNDVYIAHGAGVVSEGAATITNCAMSGNAAGDYAGGIEIYGDAVITGSTISGNSSAHFGAGIANSGGTVTIFNSTISDNSTFLIDGLDGGGIANDGLMTITSSSITGNSAPRGGGVSTENAGGVEVTNSIIAGNSGGNCGEVAIVSGGHNLSDDSTCALVEPTDLQNVSDALLGPLQDNGGPTETHALLPGSPAIDAGDDASCPATDQRGVTRPQGSGCDIGAFELEQ